MKRLFKKMLPLFMAAITAFSAIGFAGCTKVLYGTMPDPIVDDSGNTVVAKGEKTKTEMTKYVDLSDENTQYVVFMLTNRSYRQDKNYLPGMLKLHGEIDPESERMYAFGVVGPLILNHTIETMQEQVNTCFEYALKYNIPVYFQMDDCKQYFTYNTGSTQTFGNEDNCVHTGAIDGKEYRHYYEDPDMCEWIALPEAGEEWGGKNISTDSEHPDGILPSWICDWGGDGDHVAGGYPCFNSESYLAWYDNQIQEGFIKPLIENLIKLQKLGKEYLFAGVCTGWETELPDYTDEAVMPTVSPKLYDWEKAQFGMHAIYNIKDENGNRLYDTNAKLQAAATAAGKSLTEFKRELLYPIIHDYIEHTCKLFYDAGISRYKISSHTISWSSHNGEVCDTFAVPIWVSINDYSVPGWTMAETCPYNLNVIYKYINQYAPGLNMFANSEGYTSNGGGTIVSCKTYMQAFLGGNARLITIFGYEDESAVTATMGYPRNEDFYFTRVIKQWMNYEFLPNYSLKNRPSLAGY